MPINEVFLNPTVKQVIFQIRFPNLFAMEKMIGDYQLKIMDRFPNSQLLFSKNFIIANVVPGKSIQDVVPPEESGIKKIWNFKSDNGVELNVQTDSIDMTSTLHKTYNNPSVPNRFRDAIEFAIKSFFEIVRIPKINRIGLRYIDECPVTNVSSVDFLKWYNTAFALQRFPIEEAVNLNFEARVRKGDCFLRFMEVFQNDNGKLTYTLDMDGYKSEINSTEYLQTTDRLHDLICDEFKTLAKAPLLEYMRRPKSV